ncbi:MAG: Asp-tRNA(Asn)/Glu-tRNA(Gln) amidotransferase GatCAB subunit B [Nanoarchaeota archaeon]|jgi:aspartyl-tRNA(Asn)/glutamyl-tRNA(Gln) amidotransferase subunit B|nr:Asp-tRNA(Asn)/Glu-tRNA(Gln) amidotransferase GatCAB subunit B [Nanoarchaeota archaeon]|tara:strand:+ start:2228 stop:3574 length:1347 start_codon:yes stop_codon:yes gene_type:complete
MTKIGIECHVQLLTRSKIFCSCPTLGDENPNTRICPTCLGLPGSKPVLNKEALNQALKVALALNCKVSEETFFSRKSYFYPDLVKNYQITQYEFPIGAKGKLENINITRIHLEEDPGALIHQGNTCLIDYNRSGIPLIEIVTEPDFKTPNEVRLFLKKLITMLEYLGVYNRTSEAALKADANISTTGEKVEIKNITGLKEIQRALEYEASRQEAEPAKIQETRGWNPEKGITFPMRTKEFEEDYGYIADPDLPKITFSKTLINTFKKSLPELSLDKVQRFKKTYSLPDEDAETLASEKLLADLFEEVAKKIDPKLAARWLRRDLLKVLHYNKKSLKDIKLDAQHVIELLDLLQQNKINDATAKELLIKLIEKPFSPSTHVKKEKLTMIESSEELESMCKDVIKNNKDVVESYKAGKEESIHYLVGQVMRLSKGKANPKEVQKILKKLI